MTGPTLEPFTGAKLQRYIESKGGELIRVSGSHFHYRLPDGTRLGSLKRDDMVPKVLFRSVAKALGMDYREARRDIGYPVQESGRTKKANPQQKPRPSAFGKNSVLRQAGEIREAINEIDAALRRGARDSVVYERCSKALEAASREIGAALRVAQGKGQ